MAYLPNYKNNNIISSYCLSIIADSSTKYQYSVRYSRTLGLTGMKNNSSDVL